MNKRILFYVLPGLFTASSTLLNVALKEEMDIYATEKAIEKLIKEKPEVMKKIIKGAINK